MKLGRWLKRLGESLERRFPEKMSVDDVVIRIDGLMKMQAQIDALINGRVDNERFNALEIQIKQLFKEMDSIKTLTNIKTRIAPSGFGIPNPILKPQETTRK